MNVQAGAYREGREEGRREAAETIEMLRDLLQEAAGILRRNNLTGSSSPKDGLTLIERIDDALQDASPSQGISPVR